MMRSVFWALFLLLILAIVFNQGVCNADVTVFPSISPIIIKENEDLLELRCKYSGGVVGDLEPSFIWSGPSVGDSRVVIIHMVNTSALRIHNVSTSDNGTFKCMHRSSGEFATIDVIVHVDPSVDAPPSQRITVGEDGSLIMCRIDLGYPSEHSEVKWYKDDVPLNLTEDRYDATDLDQGLQIADIDPSADSGIYRCAVVRDGFETISIEIEVIFILPSSLAPKIDRAAMGYTRRLDCGEDLTLECILESDSEPADTFQWSTPDGFFSGQHLTISSPVKSGDYRCIAENIYGIDTHTVSVNALAAAMQLWIKSEVELVQEGNTIVLPCHLSEAYPGNPLAEVFWSKSGTIISDNTTQRVFVRSNNQSSSLVITNAVKSDEGNYECVAMNECGDTSRTVSNSVDSGDPSNDYAIPIGASIAAVVVVLLLISGSVSLAVIIFMRHCQKIPTVMSNVTVAGYMDGDSAYGYQPELVRVR